MSDTAKHPAPAAGIETKHIVLGVSALLALLGLAGYSHAAVGYALFGLVCYRLRSKFPVFAVTGAIAASIFLLVQLADLLL